MSLACVFLVASDWPESVSSRGGSFYVFVIIYNITILSDSRAS